MSISEEIIILQSHLPPHLPLPLHKIIIDYCEYPKKYLLELTIKISTLKRDIDMFESHDISRTSLSIFNAKSTPILERLRFGGNGFKSIIISRLFERENDRRKEFGLLANKGIYNYFMSGSSLISINY